MLVRIGKKNALFYSLPQQICAVHHEIGFMERHRICTYNDAL